MEKLRKRLYQEMTVAYSDKQLREDPIISSSLLAASNQLLKQQSPILTASQLYQDIENYQNEGHVNCSKTLLKLKYELGKYS